MLTIREVADYLSLSQRTIYRLVEEGAIPAFKIGGQWRFEQAALEQWVRAEISHHHGSRRSRHAVSLQGGQAGDGAQMGKMGNGEP